MQSKLELKCLCYEVNGIREYSSTYLQIVSFRVVKKSEATSREYPRNHLTCSWLIKTQGFHGCACCW